MFRYITFVWRYITLVLRYVYYGCVEPVSANVKVYYSTVTVYYPSVSVYYLSAAVYYLAASAVIAKRNQCTETLNDINMAKSFENLNIPRSRARTAHNRNRTLTPTLVFVSWMV